MIGFTRQFGGNLTETEEQTMSRAAIVSTLQADAPEFRPSQQHQQRPTPTTTRGGRPAAPKSRQNNTKPPRGRRLSSLKSTAPDIATRTHEDIASGVYECAISVSRSGLLTRGLPWLNCAMRRENFRPGNGDVQGVICLRMLFHQRMHAGVRRNLTHVQSRVYRLIHAGRRVANIENCPRSAPILVSSFVTLVRALLVRTLVLFRAASAAKSQPPGDVWTRITILGGAVERYAEI
ncbi:hypothetical protein MMC28_004617 [Mycoblastus sanguinarius]|nr:hypothetical protein [Mycoblastus sanguinarius]